MILQIGSFFGSLLSGIGGVVSQVARQVLPTGLDIGRQFLQRELDRKLQRRQRQAVSTQAVQALNTPGISVARLGGTIQPVGGRVQRSTFTPAAFTPAQSPLGNIPLLPVGSGLPLGATFPLDPFAFRRPVQALVRGIRGMPTLNGTRTRRPPGAPGEPRFAKDSMGNTVMFVPAPDGSGFITVAQARALGNGIAMKPFWRFNRLESQFEKIKPRRMNPFNFRATKRAGRRVERTLDAVKELVRIERKMTTGKVRLKRTKRRKR